MKQGRLHGFHYNVQFYGVNVNLNTKFIPFSFPFKKYLGQVTHFCKFV
jgi:hypothetical protein